MLLEGSEEGEAIVEGMEYILGRVGEAVEGMRIVVDEDGASEEFAGAHDVFFALEGVV